LSFGEGIKTCFQKYADFRGRAPRPEFWWFVLLYYIVVFALAWPYVFGWPNFDESDAAWALFGFLTGLAFLALLLPCLAVGARRLLDSGKSGAWWFIGLVPFGWVVLLVFFASDGDQGLNRYGPPPVSKPPLPRHRAPFRLHHLLPSGSPRVSSGLESNLVPRVPLLTVAEHHARQRDYFPSTCRVSSL
jgi:uncharacterized membrane protein YhaH (DUF805 family)